LGVTGDAALVLERDHSVQVQGSGFDPNSDAQVYVFSQARLLGTVHTDATGAFTGLVQVPGDLELGHHTLQIDALDAGGSVRSLSLGVVVHEPRKSDTQAVARATVMFASGSASLTSQAQRELRALVRATGGRATGGLVVGYVQRDGRFASNAALSAKRASAVARYLQAHGISATLTTRGDGALSPQDTARKAMVTLRYPT
jgi:outer membrane protein OmpA-like peptidoglycan-associated protein